MEKQKNILGEEHPDTLTTIGNLAATYRDQGQWKEAEALEEVVMEKTKHALGEEHSDTLTSMANLASTYWNQGQWKEAEQCCAVMTSQFLMTGHSHDWVMTSHDCGHDQSHDSDDQSPESHDLVNDRHNTEAEALEVVVMEKMKHVLGEEHPDTLISMGNLAATYRQQSQWKEAEALEVVVVEKTKHVLIRRGAP